MAGHRLNSSGIILQRGMTLLESLVAVALIGISFVGLQAFYVVAQRSLAGSATRVQLNLAAEGIMEDITLDRANVASYNGISLNNCVALNSKPRVWCERLNAKVGTPAVGSQEFRRIQVVRETGAGPNTWVVTVEFSTQGGRNHAVIRRRVKAS